MLCTRCDTRNEDNARFCRACGIPLVATSPAHVITDEPMTGPACPACSRLNPAGARYCVYCATPIAADALPTAVPAVHRLWQAPSQSGTAGFQGAAGSPGFQAAPAHAVATNAVTIVNYGTPQLIQFGVAGSGADLLVRAIWFFFIGWWLGLIWTLFAWLFNLTLIGMPVGAMMLNAIPQVMTLRRPRTHLVQTGLHGPMVAVYAPQHPLPLRVLWFLLVGWWASLLWMLMAWAFSASLLLMPIAFWMFNRVPTITTLAAEG